MNQSEEFVNSELLETLLLLGGGGMKTKPVNDENEDQQHWGPPEPYHSDNNEDDNEEPYMAEIVHKKKKKRVITHNVSIYYFTFDVYKVGPNGTKPGKYTFLTKETRINPDCGAFEWKVEDIAYRERSRRRNKTKEEGEFTWFEKECNLLKKDVY